MSLNAIDILKFIKDNKLEDYNAILRYGEIRIKVKVSNGTIQYYLCSDGYSNTIADFKDPSNNKKQKIFLNLDEAMYMRDHNEISHKLLYEFQKEKKKEK